MARGKVVRHGEPLVGQSSSGGDHVHVTAATSRRTIRATSAYASSPSSQVTTGKIAVGRRRTRSRGRRLEPRNDEGKVALGRDDEHRQPLERHRRITGQVAEVRADADEDRTEPGISASAPAPRPAVRDSGRPEWRTECSRRHVFGTAVAGTRRALGAEAHAAPVTPVAAPSHRPMTRGHPRTAVDTARHAPHQRRALAVRARRRRADRRRGRLARPRVRPRSRRCRRTRAP